MSRIHPLIRCSAIWSFVLSTTVLAQSPDVAAALAHRAQRPEADWPYLVYWTTNPHAGDAALAIGRALRMTVASNSRQRVLQRCTPQPVVYDGLPTGLFWADMRDLYWGYDDVFEVLANRNPYTPKGIMPLVVRADWFIDETTDAFRSDSYDGLFYGFKNIPQTREDYFKQLGIITDPRLAQGAIESKSKVAVIGTRRITWQPLPGGDSAYTEDSRELVRESDPFETLLGQYKHDAEEHIAWIPKLWIGDAKNDGQPGVLARYILFNGDGKRQSRAPVDIVHDYLRFNDLDEIRYPVNCFGCHAGGANGGTENQLQLRLRSKQPIYAGRDVQESIEAFHLTSPANRIERLNDDFARTVTLCTDGATPAQASDAIKATLAAYRQPLYLAETADELGLDVGAWTKTLAPSTKLSGRLASLAYGQLTKDPKTGAVVADTRGSIARVAWEPEYLAAYEASHGGTPSLNVAGVKPLPVKVEEPPAAPPKAQPKQQPRPQQPQPNNRNNNGGRFR